MVSKVLKKQWATSKDWAAHRETISRMYRDMELEDLMALMERKYHFYSTARMYKTKIRDWGIGKRLRDEDVVAILYLMDQNRHVKSGLEFWVRGYRVNDDNIRRYLRRKQGLLAQFRAGRVPQPRELEQVRFVLKGPGLRADSAATGSHNPVKDAEAFMVECRDYLEGSFSSGHWVVGEDGVCTSGMSSRQAKDISEAIQSNLYTAVKALKRSEFTEAFKILDISFRSAKKAIESDVPRVLALTLNAMVMLDRHGQEDILRVFLRYVRSQSRSLSGRSQKLARVFDGLSRIDRSLYEDVFELVFGLLVDRSDSMFGAGSYLSFEIFWDYFATMLVQRSFPVQVDRLAKQLAKVDLADRGRPWIARVERLLAWKVAQWKSSTGDEAEAERALRAAEDTLDESSPADEVVLHHQFSGKMYMAMNRLAAAEESFVKALRRQVGDTDQPNLEDSIQYGLSQLAIILDRRGRVQEAEDVRTYAHDRLRRLTADIDWDWDEFARRTAEEKLPGGDDED